MDMQRLDIGKAFELGGQHLGITADSKSYSYRQDLDTWDREIWVRCYPSLQHAHHPIQCT
jgi:hypothetical protein